MLWVPQKGIIRSQTNTGNSGVSIPGTNVTTGATSSTKGAVAQLIASTDFDAYWISIVAQNYFTAATATDMCLDILIGAATEEVLIPNILGGYCGHQSTFGGGLRWEFPLYIPAGSRIAAQAAGLRTEVTFQVAIFLYGGNGVPPFRVGSKVTTYGIGTVPNGVSITPGASGAAGSWTEITASTSEDHFCLVPSMQLRNITVASTSGMVAEMGIGAVTEELISQPYWYGVSSSELMGRSINSFPTFQDIPSGSRLVMRSSQGAGAGNVYDGAIHAVS
jgi:hypothetical protein